MQRKIQNKLFFVIGVIIVFLPWHVCAQKYDPPLRIEIPVPSENNSCFLTPVEKEGLILLSDNHDGKTWNITHYDTNLAIKVDKQIAFNNHLVFCQDSYNNHIYCAAFQSYNQNSNQYNCSFLCYDMQKKTINVYAISLHEKESVCYMSHINNMIVFSTVNNKNDEYVYLFDCGSSVCKKMDICENSYSVECIQADTVNRQILIGIIGYRAKYETYIKLIAVGASGQSIEKEYVINLNKKYFLSSLKMSVIDNQSYLLSGDYYLSNNMSASEINRASTGIYSLMFNPQKEIQASYFDFTDIENLSAYQKKIFTAGTSHNHTSLLYADDSIQILATEFFSIDYEQDMTTPMNMYYSGMYTGNTRISGYKYLNAVITTIQKDGSVKKCDIFNFNGLTLPRVMRMLNGYKEEQQLLVFFSYDGNIYSIVYEPQLVTPMQAEAVKTYSGNDIISKNYTSFCCHWYQNIFLNYGYQKIISRNSNKRNNSRIVFYVTKLIYD
ncbi:MAG: hypothetical protein J5701_01335 [Bacteroidales bacterium]|nr:hypothetical protein [Bacteroidales bacterium]